MSDVTHSRGPWPGVGRCGERLDEPFVDDPTCLACIAEGPEPTIAEIISMNSVKDLQEIEDARFLEHIDAAIAIIASKKS